MPTRFAYFAFLSVGLWACSSDSRGFLQSDASDSQRVANDTANQPDTAGQWLGCEPGETRCFGDIFQRCLTDGEFTRVSEDVCSSRNMVCDSTLGACTACHPGEVRCSSDRAMVLQCSADGQRFDTTDECALAEGQACSSGQCRSLCEGDDVVGTNIGCEYFAVDLDNAQLGDRESAASQQYAIVVSNPHPTLQATVRIERNNAPYGQTVRTGLVASAVIPPLDLEVFPLPPREVDCSAPGTFNTGTGTCLSSQAYRVTSSIPVLAAQFNPLVNEYAFSNDASLLLPTNSLLGSYMVLSWPQTLASSPPESVLNPGSPVDLRGFVTVVGTRPNTRVRVVPRADVLPGGPLLVRQPANTAMEVTLGPFDVLNLETDGFRADLTGTIVEANGPVSVFSGSECSDVPAWEELGARRCCCDHLESQQFPRTTLGSQYIAVHTPRRTPIVQAAGAPVAQVERESEFFRVLSVGTRPTQVTTTLPQDPDDIASEPLVFELQPGEVRTLRAYSHFAINADGPIAVANFMSSQENTGIPLRFPGGDGSFIPMPSIEQWRASYVFHTPLNYAFDFVMIVAPTNAVVQLDRDVLPTQDCIVERADGCVQTMQHPCPVSRYSVYSCQLSYPTINPDLPYPMNITPGIQRDGVHTVLASEPVGAIVSGFDLRVSYGYPAGTRLRPLF